MKKNQIEKNLFEDRIRKYPNIWKTYELAMTTSLEMGLKEKAADTFISKNCRVWFLEKHLKVEREASDQELRDINKSPLVPFLLTDIQLERLDSFESQMASGKKFRIRVMKCRRANISTIYVAIGYHIVRFNENKKGLVFADRLETSRKLRRILDVFYQTDDLYDKPEVGKRTQAEGLYLHAAGVPRDETARDSFILIGSGEQANSGIGGSLDFMLWSEASLTNDATTHWTTISPSLKGAIFDVAESTPSLTGQDEVIFPEFEKPTDGCDRKFISWLDVAEYRIDDQIKIKDFAPYIDHNLYGKEAEIMAEHNVSIPQMLWRRMKLDDLKSISSFRQVFPISLEEAFYGSAGLFFHKTIIDMTKPEKKYDIIMSSFSDQGNGRMSLVNDDSGAWKIYDRASIEYNYLIATDIAEGKSADKEGRDPDYSVAMIFRLSNPIMEVGMLRERIPPEILAEQVGAAAKYYNDALIMPERNGPGLAMLVRLLQIYQNVYKQQKHQSGSFVQTMDFGFQTTSPSKVYALSCLLQQIRDQGRGLKIQSDIVRVEMSKFAQNGSKFGALSGYHDDTISCLWLMAVGVFQTPTLMIKRDALESSGQFSLSGGHWKPEIERDDWNYSKE